jgi:hypothetical protein
MFRLPRTALIAGRPRAIESPPLVVYVEIVTVNEAETDEMRSFAGDKSRQYWLWRAIDHSTGEPLAFRSGTREYENPEEILDL